MKEKTLSAKFVIKSLCFFCSLLVNMFPSIPKWIESTNDVSIWIKKMPFKIPTSHYKTLPISYYITVTSQNMSNQELIKPVFNYC